MTKLENTHAFSSIKSAAPAIVLCAASMLAVLFIGCENASQVEGYSWNDPNASSGSGNNNGSAAGGDATADDGASDAVSATDDVPFSSLQWKYGKYDGSGKTQIDGQITSLSCNGSVLSYSAKLNSNWGSYAGGHDGISAVFIQRSDGSWTGGKFDWTGSVGKPRPLQHLADYNGWRGDYPIPKGTRIAYVVVKGSGGSLRTNVATCTVR